MPVFARRDAGVGLAPVLVGLPVRLAPGRAVSGLPLLYPGTHGPQRQLWSAVRIAAGSPQTVESEQGWTRVLVAGVPSPGDQVSLVMRDDDWLLLRAAIDARAHDPAALQDAPVEQVLAHHLARLDGLDGTPGEGWWGRLALEVVSLRVPRRIADTVSLRWTACWGRAGFGAGSDGRTAGSGDRQTLSDLVQHRFALRGRAFRVRALPDWEREQAAHDLGLPVGRLLAWPVIPLPTLVQHFDDRVPAQAPDGAWPTPGPVLGRPQDGRPRDADPAPDAGPQDAR